MTLSTIRGDLQQTTASVDGMSLIHKTRTGFVTKKLHDKSRSTYIYNVLDHGTEQWIRHKLITGSLYQLDLCAEINVTVTV